MNRIIRLYFTAIFLFFFSVTLYSLFSGRFTIEVENFVELSGEVYHGYFDETGEPVGFPFKCSICALIGTSGHLLKLGLGSEIDELPCIFRLGFAPSRGYEEHVGMRTTARIVDSYRFSPFLKKPQKLITGPSSAENFFIFDRSEGDITRFHAPVLSSLLQKYDINFLWFSKRLEKEVRRSLEVFADTRGQKMSSLWFATRVIQDSGCKRLFVYGIPDAQICKRSMNVTVPSVYWDNDSDYVCWNGVDASYKMTNISSPYALLPSVPERRALEQWADDHLTSIKFKTH